MRTILILCFPALLFGQQVNVLPQIFDRYLGSSARNEIDFSKGAYARMFIEVAVAPSGDCTIRDGQKWVRPGNEIWGCKDDGDGTWSWALISGGSSGAAEAAIQAGTPFYVRSTTGNDSYVGCPSTPITVLTRGMLVTLDGDTGNTGAATLNLCAQGVKSIIRNDSSALTDGLITANKPISLVYDGTYFVPVGPPAPDATSGIAGSLLIPILDRVSSTQVRLGNNCGVSTPCGWRINSSVYIMTAPVTLDISGTCSGSPVGFYLIDSSTPRFGHNSLGGGCTITPSVGLTVVSGTTAVPIGAISIQTPTVTANAWNTLTPAMLTATVLGTVTPTQPGTGMIESAPGVLSQANTAVTPGSYTSANITVDQQGNITAAANGSASGYDPSDTTKFFRHISFVSGTSYRDSFRETTTNCPTGNGSASGTGSDTTSLFPWWWLATNGDTTLCAIRWPYVEVWGGGIPNYFSGASPILHKLTARMGKVAVNGGTYFVAWTQDPSNLNNSFGCRAASTGNWFAFIRASGSDVSTADTTVANSTSSLKVVARNGATSATANSITCSVNGTAATATGTIPSGTDWYAVIGMIQAGGTATVMRASMMTVDFQGLP